MSQTKYYSLALSFQKHNYFFLCVRHCCCYEATEKKEQSLECHVLRLWFLAFHLTDSHFNSIIGGHPHNWNNLNKACLGKIQKFITKLNESVPAPNPPATKDQQPSQNTQTTTLYSTGSNLRPLATTSKATSEANNNQKAGGGISKSKVEEVLIKSVLNAYPVKILKAIKEKFSNNALFNSAPDAETRSVFDECQVIIWAVEGKEQNEATKNRGRASRNRLLPWCPFFALFGRHSLLVVMYV